MDSILICDDEKDIVEALNIYLTSEGYRTFKAYNGAEALEMLKNESIQLVLLDVMMPQMDGITALSRIRDEYNVPVILLTAKGEDTDKILGLNVGADDYVTKPFNPVELMARVRAQLRRYTRLGGKNMTNGLEKCGGVYTAGGLSLDDNTKRVTVEGEDISLTPTEFKLLRFFLMNPGKVFTTTQIYRSVWEDSPVSADRTVTVHIRHLREKIEINPSEPRYIKVVWGQGYKLEGN